jgi:hypothetical protein
MIVDPGTELGVKQVAIGVALGSNTAQRTASQGRSAHLDHSLSQSRDAFGVL